MVYVAIALPWLLLLMMLWALLAGQSAAQKAQLEQIATLSAESAMWRATVIARPYPTPTPCWRGTLIVAC